MYDVESEVADDELPPEISAQSLILHSDAEWIIVVPQTAAAAMWWGRYTAWCTAEEESYFHHYRKRGPLVMLCSRSEGLCWQLHPVTGEFRDDRNRRASWRGFLCRYPGVLDAITGYFAGS